MPDILSVFLPQFLLVLLGGLIRGWITPEAWAGINRLIYCVFFPAMLFHAASGHAIVPSTLVTISLCVWAIMGVGFGMGLMTRSLGPERFVDFAGIWQTAWRFNSALAFVVMASLPPESAALMSVAIGVGVPMANLLAVGALSRGNGLGLAAMLKQVAINPFLLASMAGISVAITGLALPAIPMKSIASLSSIAVPLALISLGASMNWKALYRLGRLELAINTIKLIALPLAALILGELLGLPKSYTVVLIAFAALPTGTVGHIMAAAFGADSARVSTMIAQSTLFGLLTLPCWMFAAHLL